MTQDISSRAEAGVLTVAFSRLQRKNAITSAMYAAMADALATAGDDPAMRAVVIQGDESVFTAGNDLGDFLEAGSGSADRPVFRFLHALAGFKKPLLAAVCGPAVGIGTTMLFHCDLVYADDNAEFAMPFVNLGLCPEAASSLLAPRMFGYHRAAEALLLGESFSAETAKDHGLVNKVLPPAEVAPYAQSQARKLAAKPLASVLEIKRLMKGAQSLEVVQRMADENASFVHMLGQPAAKEAIKAFMEKRKPDFSGL